MNYLTLVSLLLPAFTSLLFHVKAEPCIAMDTGFNLLVFGVDGKDYNAGTQDQWTSGMFVVFVCSGFYFYFWVGMGFEC